MLMSKNLESCFHFSQLAYPLPKSSGVGTIVFISSVLGMVSLQYASVYSATKGALNQLTKNLACEWARGTIRVNSVAPRFIRTSMVGDFFEVSGNLKLKKIGIKNSNEATWRTRRSFIPRGFPSSLSCFFHHWSSRSC